MCVNFFRRCKNEFDAVLLDSSPLDSFLGKYKKDLFEDIQSAQLPQVVLEIGIGNGPNLKYLSNHNVHLMGVDPNPSSLRKVKKKAEELDIQNFDVKQGTSENLPIEDSSIDHVVVTLVLCSVSDVDKSLKEIERVLKPGGRFYFIEHVISPNKSIRRFMQRVFSPFQQFFAGGCHLDRDLLDSLNKIQVSQMDVTTLDSCCCCLEGPLLIGSAICSKKE
eukprot:TRINITY_DN25430_c0_g1_i2.p2 TRINITY_DN25430_c0_g1~~TRINITY_DN25430_c0_g1_i2.p2  ORF type:complete len:220 (-),score=39.42 TRINITY_DN25430_c0_g1_i2:763-1422(-)